MHERDRAEIATAHAAGLDDVDLIIEPMLLQFGQQGVTQGAGHVAGSVECAHATHAARPRAVQPTEDLLGAERGFTLARHALAQLLDGERSKVQRRGV